jgi:hypothetical protein
MVYQIYHVQTERKLKTANRDFVASCDIRRGFPIETALDCVCLPVGAKGGKLYTAWSPMCKRLNILDSIFGPNSFSYKELHE